MYLFFIENNTYKMFICPFFLDDVLYVS